MNITSPLTLLGGLSPSQFMKDYWQRKPLLIRQAIPGFKPSLSINEVKTLVKREEVESRLVWHDDAGWHMKTGPFNRLPGAQKPGWTVLAQNVDAHDDDMAALMRQFRFISDARLDDAMISIATDGGGVGPHFDSYDVFLLQAVGRRHWRISTQKDLSLVPGLPLKILANFQTEQEFVLEPGDMLYLPPHVAHDGIAQGDCMTISIGFRAPTTGALARGLLDAAGDQIMAKLGDNNGLYANPLLPGPVLDKTYKDRGAPATPNPALLPDSLVEAALEAVSRVKFTPELATRFLGQWLTEPSQAAWFEPGDPDIDLLEEIPSKGQFVLDRCTRLMYRDNSVFINGEVAPVDTKNWLKRLADERVITCADLKKGKPTEDALEMLNAWLDDGWLRYEDTP